MKLCAESFATLASIASELQRPRTLDGHRKQQVSICLEVASVLRANPARTKDNAQKMFHPDHITSL